MKNENLILMLAVAILIFVIYFFRDTDLQQFNPSNKRQLAVHTCFNNDSYRHEELKCRKNYFNRIALVIIYNNPFYDSIPLLHEFYGPIFRKIFFCGSVQGKSFKNITVVDIRRGLFGYECLAEVIRSHHNFDGYFYINDDVILNYWNLIDGNFDFDLIWHSNNQYGYVNLNESIPTAWYWWVSPYGFNNTKQAVQEIHTLGKRYKMYHRLFRTFIKNGNNLSLVHSGRSDILYIPQKFAMKFQELSRIFYRHQVFLEIAIPTMLRFLTESNQLKVLSGHYIPGDVRKNDQRVIDSRIFWMLYLSKPYIWFIHPFKLHHKSHHNRDLNLLLLKHLLIAKTQRYVQCLTF